MSRYLRLSVPHPSIFDKVALADRPRDGGLLWISKHLWRSAKVVMGWHPLYGSLHFENQLVAPCQPHWREKRA